MSEYILNMQQVTVSSKTRKNILNIEHFALRPGELVAVLGPNGAGKSTLLNTINLLQPFQGKMQLFGQDVHNANQTLLRRRSALVFQEKLLLNDTVFNNVARALEFRGTSAKEIKQKVYTTLADFGGEHLANRSVRSLSGGEAKRVCIARALVTDPELLLLDEPSASLDLGIRAGMIEKIRQWAEVKGASVILISHNFTDILRFAERAIALFDGCIVQDDKLETLIRRPANEQLARLVGIDNIIPCQVKQSSHGSCIKLANGIKFSYPGEIKKSITACCLSSDTFNLCDASSSIQHKPWSVIIEGLVERVLNGMGTYNIWVKVGEQTLIARMPQNHVLSNVHRHEMIKLAFNAADAHFV
ncbi:energy-coupling factor ABC transporter ATP-binding protein [Nostocaceae cyanobacterium CENA369]|uniref:Energy-coupling factor ABC transporter ATP-binding protein n=1 Tax=Dendronalium phyllosphericum CENA369 TaxID=1725256 RepID=A0A8J7I6G7_9NOST|nr:energy-coupling factor ABC transporter ATP-binding protein [Dendronalium phyllosphericum]MBH8576584.1 energy-coupling factor ABC transporter ATP-binding protein [Dendronalium phyllosphericum CENA369]